MAKFRNGFVSNSSSCSFLIYNKTAEPKSWKDFITEAKKQVKQAIKDGDLTGEYKPDLHDVSPSPTLPPFTAHALEVSNEGGGIWSILYSIEDGETDSFIWGTESVVIKR